MARIKLVVMAGLAILGMIVVLQNTEPVNTRLLLWSVTMPRAVLLLGTSLIGFSCGVLVTFFMGDRKGPDRETESPPRPKQLDE